MTKNTTAVFMYTSFNATQKQDKSIETDNKLFNYSISRFFVALAYDTTLLGPIKKPWAMLWLCE